MQTYKYKAISKEGERVSGVIEAFNELDAADRVRQSYETIVKLTLIKDDNAGILNMDIGKPKLNNKAFTMMCSQFSIILRAGVPVARTVRLIAEKTTDKPLKKMLIKVGEDVRAGRSLSASFAEHGAGLLPPTFVETISAGEESGNIDKSFESMYLHHEKQAKMRNKVKAALSYPIFVMIIAVIVVIVLMVKVVPTFTRVFADLGGELPLMTRMLISISEFFKVASIPVILVIIAGIIGLKLYARKDNGRLKLARFQLKLPVLGNIARLNAASQFANTLGMMMHAGLPLTRAITITAKVIDNFFMGQETDKLTKELEAGKTLGSSMREAEFMPDILVDMVSVGEETGELENTLETVAEYYDTELEEAISSAIRKMEPTILVFLALVAGFIVIAIYMAMFGMYNMM